MQTVEPENMFQTGGSNVRFTPGVTGPRAASAFQYAALMATPYYHYLLRVREWGIQFHGIMPAMSA